jgi:hypothetical protein
VRKLRHAQRRQDRSAEQRGLQPDDGVEAERADGLAREQRGGDERRGAGAAHPAVLEALAQRERVGEHADRRERGRVQQVHQDNKRGEISKREQGRQSEAGDQHGAQCLDAVADAPGGRRGEQAQRGPGGQHHSELLVGEAAALEEGGQERGGHAEGRIHRGVQQDVPRQRVHCSSAAMLSR